MPQVSQRPPPYSREWSSFPPPLQADVHHRAWAFQLAFENAREILRWSIVRTFEEWQNAWKFKGKRISRGDLQQAYSQAPDDLKQAVDWQLRWDTPVIMLSDQCRRWHDYVRRKEAGTYQEILPLGKFEEEFDAAPPSIQKAVRLTVSAWTSYNEPARLPPPPRERLASVYEGASPSLRLALCFVLEMGLICPLQRLRTLDETRDFIHAIVAQDRAQVPSWEVQGREAGLW